ncbi:pyridoxal-dependent decarboxylase domain-containing protein 1 isoform X1 [Coccinella septempunctata]|uniref:pyridoxal-dependent decarboxylase domain-containing protein 1 isoform X1 n=1 Tax=Coccinella septempunctata TaxID=41139 RepID=UPI001D06DCCB|nr:pyridoxal-dependent decarboxylase domain-containing protein 1 isoform X1 [Coccinella septempunctata]
MASPPSPKDKILSNGLKNTKITSMSPEKEQNNIGEIAIEASEIVSRLEQIAEGVPIPESAYSQPTVFLGLDRKSVEEIMDIIYGLMSVDEDGEPLQFPSLDVVTKLVIVCHSLAAYCGGLERGILQKLSTRFTTDTTRWISHLCGFLDSSTFYHEDQLEGLVRVTKMMLHYKYPRYLEDGALALTNSLPMIYSSVSSPLGVVQHLCRQLGLPLACVRPVPVNTLFGSQYTMDVAALQKLLQEDVATGKTPLIVMAEAGTFITGHVDNISRIQELCKAHDIWLHLRGHSLATFFLPNLSNKSNQMQPIADSYTLTFGSWFGIPGIPMVTLYRVKDSPVTNRTKQVGANRESTLPLLAGLNTDHQGRRIISLPLWACLQRLGQEGVQSKIRDNFIASENLWMALNVFRNIRILSPRPGGEAGNYTISELLTRPTSIPVLLESTATCVVFQFTPDWTEGEMFTKVPPYYDKLNSWLGQILHQDAPQIPLEICELENIGVVLRFCPFENSTGKQPTTEEIGSFIQCLEQQLVILKATIQHKETFIHLVEQSPVLNIVELPEWAGLGGVRYAPEGWEQLLTDQAKNELNNLNIALVEALRTTDSAFSLGEGADGLMCIRFGMLTPQSDVEDLLNLVIKVGQSVEENSRVLDSMAEIVKKGIETATLDLQKENEELLWQDGILRHVPVVGTFVNWWSPKPKETGVKGRSLNLTQGVVESTENIYKYHMQIQTGTTPQGSKSPPTPLIQTSVGGHSRSSSHASHTSSQGAANNQQGEEPAEKSAQNSTLDKSGQNKLVNSIVNNAVSNVKETDK